MLGTPHHRQSTLGDKAFAHIISAARRTDFAGSSAVVHRSRRRSQSYVRDDILRRQYKMGRADPLDRRCASSALVYMKWSSWTHTDGDHYNLQRHRIDCYTRSHDPRPRLRLGRLPIQALFLCICNMAVSIWYGIFLLFLTSIFGTESYRYGRTISFFKETKASQNETKASSYNSSSGQFKQKIKKNLVPISETNVSRCYSTQPREEHNRADGAQVSLVIQPERVRTAAFALPDCPSSARLQKQRFGAAPRWEQ